VGSVVIVMPVVGMLSMIVHGAVPLNLLIEALVTVAGS
jgi:hypothetical protein